MAEIGKATLTVVPKISGLNSAVNNAFAQVNTEAAGVSAGTSYGKGIGKTGAIAGAFAAVTNKALEGISSHLGDAISRFDTLNNYPRVMQSLGYSSESAEASISKMSDKLQGLPTSLDSMVSLTQGLVTTTGDLDKATDAALALNDMLLASGSSQQLVNSAQEQFRQILSKGEPEMQDWKSLTMAMPGQLDQLAKSMLGPTANANDLYTALGGGKAEATISMDELLDEIIKLDSEGGDGFDSFREQAEKATGGVATSMTNLGTAITRGLSGVLDEIGQDKISGVFKDLKGGIDDAFSAIQGAVGEAMPVVESLYNFIKMYAPQLVAGGTAAGVFSKAIHKASDKAETMSQKLEKGTTAQKKWASAAGKLSGKATAITAAVSIAAFGISALAGYIQDTKEKQENLTKSTTGLKDAVSRVSALDDYAGKIDGIGSSSSFSAMSVDELTESIAKSVDTMNERSSDAEEQIGKLNTAQGIINDYAGKTDLSTEAQGKLAWAIEEVNEQLGLNISAQDVANDKYLDQDGKVKNLRDSINELVEAKKREIQMDVLTQSYSEALTNRQNAADAYVAAKEDRRKALEEEKKAKTLPASDVDWTAMNKRLKDTEKNLKDTLDAYYGQCDAVEALEEDMGDLAKSTGESATALDEWGNGLDEIFKSTLRQKGTSLTDLKGDLENLGIAGEELSKLEPGTMQGLADSYDGTAASIIEWAKQHNIAMDEAKIATAQAVADMSKSLEELDFKTPLEEAHININDFSQALVDSGISTDKLKEIGSDNFAALAEACDGNISLMIAAIQLYNAEPIIDKDGKITTNQTQLSDALGNMYTWNGTQLIDQNGNVYTEEVELVDTLGNFVVWDKTTLKKQEGDVSIEFSSLTNCNKALDTYQKTDIEDKNATVRIKYVTDTRTFSSGQTQVYGAVKLGNNAAGGIRPHADGGYRYHADGAIATSAVPLDIVGEDGAEAIVPLTNRRYAQPFIDMLAEGLSKQERNPTINNVTIRMAYNASADAKDITRGIARQIKLHGLMRG